MTTTIKIRTADLNRGLTVTYYRLADGTHGSFALSRRDHSAAARLTSMQLHNDDEYDFAILRVVDER